MGINDFSVVGLSDYLNVGEDNILSKALEAGTALGSASSSAAGYGDGGPLKLESLESLLKNITYKRNDLSFWRTLAMKGCVAPAYNTVEEFNRVVNYGTLDRGVALTEGELPQTDNTTYERVSSQVKFYGKTGIVTHPLTLVRTQAAVGDVVATEAEHISTELLRSVNRDLYFGNSGVVTQEFDGIFRSISASDSSHVDTLANVQTINLAGEALKDTDVEDGAERIVNNHGLADTLLAPPGVMTQYADAYLESKRVVFGNTGGISHGSSVPQAGFGAGVTIPGQQTQFGPVSFIYDRFMRQTDPLAQDADSTSDNAPGRPGGGTAAVATDSGTAFIVAGRGAYKYGVVARNRFGRSAMRAFNGTQTVAANQSVNLSFTDSTTTGANRTIVFDIYRSLVGQTGATAQLHYIFSVTPAQRTAGFDGAAQNQVRDRGRIISGTENALLLQFNKEVLCWKQLAPLMKMNLSVIAPTIRFMILMYGTLQVYAPAKIVRYVNVKATR